MKDIILLSCQAKCYGQYETFYIKATKQFERVRMEFLLYAGRTSKYCEAYEKCGEKVAKITFDEYCIMNYVKSVLSKEAEELVANYKRHKRSFIPSVSFSYDRDGRNITEEMCVSIPYENIGLELCRFLEMFKCYGVEFDAENCEMKLYQNVTEWNDKHRGLFGITGIKTQPSEVVGTELPERPDVNIFDEFDVTNVEQQKNIENPMVSEQSDVEVEIDVF